MNREKADGSEGRGRVEAWKRVCALCRDALAMELGSDPHSATERFLLSTCPGTVCSLPLSQPSCLCSLFQKLHLSEDVAGATFMAAGSSTPELFASVIGKDIRLMGHGAERARACCPVQWGFYQL